MTMTAAAPGTDSPSVPLITVASTDLQRQAGKLLHEVERGAVVRILDLQHGEVRGYLTRECPEAVRPVVEQEGPLPAELFGRGQPKPRPEPAEAVSMTCAEIASQCGVTMRTAEVWRRDARRALSAADCGSNGHGAASA
jgi:hypothetical protein